MPLNVAGAVFNVYFRAMESTATDYKALYEESLLTISKNEEEISGLRFELDKFRKYLYGKRNEKFPVPHTGVNQMGLFELGTTQEQQQDLSAELKAEKPQPAAKPKKRAKGTGRMALPGELRRETVVIQPEEDVTGCTLIGEDVTEVLELTPAEFYVRRYVRPKYARPNGEGIVMGFLPDRVIDKGIPSESVVAQMAVDKYVYGLPLHRQIDKYAKMGVRIPASTASDWMMKSWYLLVPLWELLKLLVLKPEVSPG